LGSPAISIPAALIAASDAGGNIGFRASARVTVSLADRKRGWGGLSGQSTCGAAESPSKHL